MKLLAFLLPRLLCICGMLCSQNCHAWAELDEGRIHVLAGWLSLQPGGLGPPCNDRVTWAAAAPRLTEIRKVADKLLTQDFPKWDDEAYQEFSRSGRRARGEQMMNARKGWLYPLVMAECGDYNGRYLPVLERTLDELASQPTWTWPAHDETLQNLRRERYQVDLMAADTAVELAETIYLMGARLSPAVRERVLDALQQRVFTPVRESLAGNNDHWWLQAEHNWNAVCLSGVVGAALTVLHDVRDRSVFAAAAEHYIRRYLSGFERDGYSTEGPSYWNYGFSHFVLLRAHIMRATGNRLDLFANERVTAIARYGFRIEMLPGNVAGFGDASSKTRIDEWTRAYLRDAFAPTASARFNALPVTTMQRSSDPLVAAVASLFMRVPPAQQRVADLAEAGLRSYFEEAGVLVARPAPHGRLGVSMKGGGNTHHSHNDIGSYSIALGAEQPTGDAGATRYSAKTFSKDRYTIRAINSWGHPVPVVDGELQVDASKIKPRVLHAAFTDARDEFELDLMQAYASPLLQTLTRRLVFERASGGNVEVADHFVYSRPGRFETALITRGSWARQPDGTLLLWEDHERLQARIDGSAEYELRVETVDEEGLRFTRIGIVLSQPQRKGYVRVTFTAAP